MQLLKRLCREPLVRFFITGLALFALYALWRPGTDSAESLQRIDVTEAEVRWLKGKFESRWQRPPTAEELRGLVDNFVRQEVLYREALAMGLDRNDEVIRRRMVHKIEFMSEDLAAQQPPAEAELKSYYEKNLEKYRTPEQRRFIHIYFNADRRGDGADAAAKELLAKLRASPSSKVNTAELGDRFLLQYDDRPLSKAEVDRLFGERFATALFDVKPEEWHGPIPSSYGLHLVRVTELVKPGVAEFAAVRTDVLRDYATSVRQRARDELYSSLASRYTIEIDDEAIRAMSLPRDSAGKKR